MAKSAAGIDHSLVRELSHNLRRFLESPLRRWLAVAHDEGVNDKTTSLVVMMEAMALAASFHTGNAKLFTDLAALAIAEARTPTGDTTH